MSEITIRKGLGYRNGRPFPFVKSPNVGGSLKPRYIVIHDTASGLKDDGDVSWLTNPKAKVSAHVVISREGNITQLVPFNRVAWHAGVSSWKGLKYLNSYAIGIEIDNPGKLQKVREGVYRNDIVTIDTNKNPFLKVEYAKTKAHGAGYWLHYTDEQIKAVKELCNAIHDSFDIEDILTHWMISPGRKIDTNPLYPLEALRQSVLYYTPMGFVSQSDEGQRHDTDESGEEPVVLDAPETDRDESAGGEGKIKRFIKSKLTWASGAFSGLSITSFMGFLTDWRTIAVIAVFLLIAFALWIWSEKK